jgi:hypothetical protein
MHIAAGKKRSVHFPVLLLAALLAALCLCACGAKKTVGPSADIHGRKTPGPGAGAAEPRKNREAAEEATAVPRADPGYLQWLEKQSMLNGASGLARIVSGSELLWRGPAGEGRIDILLGAADVWLRVHPHSLLTGGSRSAFQELGDGSVLELLGRGGIRGLFIAPTNESGSVWNGMDGASAESGDDAVSLAFSEQAGSDADFERLRRQAEKRGIQLGGDVISPAVGTGPDFQLAVRAVREYPGAYMMVEIPREEWGALPPAESSRTFPPLRAEHTARLSGVRLLPPALAREAAPWTVPGGWAATGEIRCNDGQLRRWVFRWHKEPTRPMLNWDDPSGAAQRILSGSVIRQVGVLRQALAGVHIEPLIGLDAAYDPTQRSPEPALSTLRALAREIRRYGAWSIQRDLLPPELNAQILDAGPDFMADNISSPAAEYALLTGDVAPLRGLLAQSRHLDHRRLLRSLPGPEGIPLHALKAAPFPPDAVERLERALAGRCPVKNDILYSTGPSLAGAAAERRPQKNGNAEAAAEAHLLLTSLRAAMPGLFFVNGSDLAGALNIQGTSPAHAAMGGWAPNSAAASRSATRKGFERARTIYPSLRDQIGRPDSYFSRLARLNAMRAETKAARGTMLGPLPAGNDSVFSFASRLPDGSLLLAAANFSPETVPCRINAPDTPLSPSCADLLTNKAFTFTDAQLTLALAPWECRIFRIADAGAAAPHAGRSNNAGGGP